MGLWLAFVREKALERKIKRPSELEERLNIPLLISIPFLPEASRNRLSLTDRKSGPPAVRNARVGAVAAIGASNHGIRPFCEAIRDRIILSFDLQNLDHKPKLIGVTGFSSGAGSSTLAGGLAAAFSETGDGKVLLVDMNTEDGEAHPYFHGAKASSLTSLLDAETPSPSAADNLYLATADDTNSKRIRMGVRRFNSLVPTLKATDFDYIIFDMPPLGPASLSLGMARFLDKVLLVAEAERTDRDAVKRFYSDLSASGADVSCVFNKTRSYVPAWLNGES